MLICPTHVFNWRPPEKNGLTPKTTERKILASLVSLKTPIIRINFNFENKLKDFS